MSIFLVLIYLRGYLVPGTPWLTKNYFPDWLLKKFDKTPTDDHEPPESIQVNEYLAEHNAIQECQSNDDLCVNESFQREWIDEIGNIPSSESLVKDFGSFVGMKADNVSLVEKDGMQARIDGELIGQWESKVALQADLAADRIFTGRSEWWENLPVSNKSQVLHGLRLFIEKCPQCEEPVSLDNETKESCCRSYEVMTVSCSSCNTTMFELEQ
jgi:hypothetical protein